MLDTTIMTQVRSLFQSLEGSYVFSITHTTGHPQAEELKAFLTDVTACSEKLSCEVHETAEANRLNFSLWKDGQQTGISFRGIPNGHEFTSLLLAVLNADGQGKNLPDEALTRRIRALKGDISLRTYVSLTCTNCPDVVQSLNIFAWLNPAIRHEMVDGGLFQDEVNALHIQGVPSVFAGDKLLHVGRSTLGELLQKLEELYGTEPDADAPLVEHPFDVLVLGGGPAGSAAAIYSARKGLKVAIVAEETGGQVKSTVGIQNLISVPYTTGAALTNNLRNHIAGYPTIELFENRRVERVEVKDKEKRLYAKGGEVFTAPALIIATGASWRRLNVEGEAEHIGHGVAFCPHCDGPFYAGRDVAVIGGGNSGVEAAIDLAGICRHVTLVEYSEKLGADSVLQEKLRELPNVSVHTNLQTTAVVGNKEMVTALRAKNRTTGEETEFLLNGIFVQIGLTPASGLFKEQLELTRQGEIRIDEHCRTSQPGVYAAGDVSSVPYKQIIIAMGEGAKAALTAFEDRIRG
jgi:alkyl hydroperoxide reductase subunit F